MTDLIQNTGEIDGGNILTPQPFCCRPCGGVSESGFVSDCNDAEQYAPNNYYTNLFNTIVPSQKIGDGYYYEDNGVVKLCKMTEESCLRHVNGCTDSSAINFNEKATKDDGSCRYSTNPKEVCGDPNAINYVNPDGVKTVACEGNNCCQYESQQPDPLDCGCELEKLTLEREINTIDYEIEVLTRQRDSIVESNQNSFVPVMDNGYNVYIPYTNINADVQISNTNAIFDEYVNEGVYRKYISTDITGLVETDFDSLAGNPDLSDSTKWVPIISNDGVVSFVLNDVFNDGNDSLVLSHNTQESAGANLYKEFCLSKGYIFNTFYTDSETGNQVQFTPNSENLFQNNGIVTQKCVDPTYIVCDDVADIKMVFASNQWGGFNIPEDDGDTNIEISMDIMVRFNADTLLNECLESNCGSPFIDVNSTFDSGCQNYIVFTDEESISNKLRESKNSSYIVDSETGQGKWLYDTESFTLWQTPKLQNEPSTECCVNGFGGEIQESQTYLNNNQNLQFSDLEITDNQELLRLREDFEVSNRNYLTLIEKVNDCGVKYEIYDYNGCESNYKQLITTEKLCVITPPDDCLAYTTLLQDYEVMIKQLKLISDSVDLCVNEYYLIEGEIKNIDTQIIEETETINVYQEERVNFEEGNAKVVEDFNGVIRNLNEKLIEKENNLKKLNETFKVLNVKKDEEVFKKQIIDVTLKIEKEKNEISEIKRAVEDVEIKFKQETFNYTTTINNISSTINKIEKCVEGYKERKKILQEEIRTKRCCLALQDQISRLFVDITELNSVVIKSSIDCYGNWRDSLYEKYNEWLLSESDNVLQFMENTSIDFTLEVDNNLGTAQNNRVNKYTTLDSITTGINPIWEFNPSGGYSGVLLEGSENSINVVKESVNIELINRGQTPSNEIFDEQWQRVKFVLNDEQSRLLRQLYPNKQFFIGLSIKNEKNCETTLLVDNIQINTDINFLQKSYSTDNCISFDLSCIIDDRKSWVFSDGLVKTTYENKDIRCNPLPTDKKILTFPKPQVRHWDNLEYRYTDYSVNHSKLVLNSKSTTFRIDPANAIECDVYNFWQEVDCDGCNTLFSCATATTLTYTNPTGGTLPLSGVSCSSFDCIDVLTDIKYGYSTWLKILDTELNNKSLIRNMSFSVMNNTKNKPKGNQKVSNESYINDLFKQQNINKYDVSYFLPESLGIGFDIQKSDCNSDIIEIKKYNEDVYTLISEETDGRLGFYTYSADTNDICELTSLVDEQCCNRVSDYLDKTFKINKPNYGWVDGACRWKEVNSIEDSCDSDCSYYGTQVEETKFIFSGASGVTLSSTCVDTPVCIKPLDYLDKQPNQVNVKPDFDNMVLSNLIDVKSRQVISDYPLLRLFYNQYLNANGCGGSITNRLDYNTTFEVMDLIGDYWTDIIEQVVPATTIWDGCQNSGKVYRNTIFDQNKFPYKRYVLNYYNGDCEINEITRDVIAINSASTIELSEEVLTNDGDIVVVENSCDNIAKQLNEEEEKLKNNYVVGTLSYLKKKSFVDTLRIRYEICKRKSNINITQYNTMFITQIYDNNEYEGDVNVFGDPDWNSDVELLHACGSMKYICPTKDEVSIVEKTIEVGDLGRFVTKLFYVNEDGSDIIDLECCQSIGGVLITSSNGDSYCSSQNGKSLYE